MATALELAPLPGELFEACAIGSLPVDLAAAIDSSGGQHKIMRVQPRQPSQGSGAPQGHAHRPG